MGFKQAVYDSSLGCKCIVGGFFNYFLSKRTKIGDASSRKQQVVSRKA